MITTPDGELLTRVRYLQEFVLYQWGAPLQLVLDGVRHKSCLHTLCVLHGGLLRRIAFAWRPVLARRVSAAAALQRVGCVAIRPQVHGGGLRGLSHDRRVLRGDLSAGDRV